MVQQTTVSLGEHDAAFVAEQVAEGNYPTASDVVRAGLRLLEAHEAQLARLRAALIEGEESGSPEPLDMDAFLREQRAAFRRRT